MRANSVRLFKGDLYAGRSRWVAYVAVAVVTACSGQAEKSARNAGGNNNAATLAQTDSDDFGARITIDSAVGSRVVSLVPAATEIIFAMGRGNRLVGRTTWDMFPDSAKLVPNVGDGIRPNIEVVLATKPTLVVLYAGADNRTAAAAFARMGIAVLAIKADRIADFARITKHLGLLLNATERATQVIDSVQGTLEKVRVAVAGAERPNVVWPLWSAPVLVVGNGSYMSELLDIAGATNTFRDLPLPSPEVTIEEIAKRNPDYVLTSPTGAKSLEMSPKWRAVRAIRDKQLRIVDTVFTGRPTVSLGMAAVSLAKLLHPERASQLP